MAQTSQEELPDEEPSDAMETTTATATAFLPQRTQRTQRNFNCKCLLEKLVQLKSPPRSLRLLR